MQGVKGSGVKQTADDWVPFGLRFRDAELRKQIKMEALDAGVEMSVYIVAILRNRRLVPDSIIKSCFF